jgi:hypothetical protein
MKRTLTLKYEQDTKRYHRFKVIDPEGEVTGNIYIEKTMDPLPQQLVLKRKGK